MAKASSALSTAEITSNPAITVAAAEIHTLINSQPRSPTKDGGWRPVLRRSATVLGTAASRQDLGVDGRWAYRR